MHFMRLIAILLLIAAFVNSLPKSKKFILFIYIRYNLSYSILIGKIKAKSLTRLFKNIIWDF